MPSGEYIEVHQQLDEYERWRLVSYDSYQPLMIRPNSRGKIGFWQNFRAFAVPLVLRGSHRAATQREIEDGSHHH